VIVTNPVTTGGDFSGSLLQAECFTADSIRNLID